MGMRSRAAINALRYGLPAACVVAGFVILFAANGPARRAARVVAACATGFPGAGRAGGKRGALRRGGAVPSVPMTAPSGAAPKGDRAGGGEEGARRYLAEHGRWPDD